MANLYAKCVICDEHNVRVVKGSLYMSLEKVDHIPESSMTWAIMDICRNCYPGVIEKINALYEEIISKDFENTMPS